MVQAVADSGRLVAHHANLRVLEGVGGGASLKESMALGAFREHLERLVGALRWTGALSMDVIVTPQGPLEIDVNPRIVEPMNAHLVSPMLELASGKHPSPAQEGRVGVRSRQLLLAILGAAEQTNSRKAILQLLRNVSGGRDELGKATEELTPVTGDLIAALPAVSATVATLIRPSLWRQFHLGAVGPYALTPEAWDRIVAAGDALQGSARPAVN
jgi:hypothetical protein